MSQQSVQSKKREHSYLARVRALYDSGTASHSRVGTLLGWLQEALLLVSLAVVCSSSFDIANGRTSDQLDDVTGMLRIAAIGICFAILIGLYLSIFRRPLRSSARSLPPSPALAPAAVQPALEESSPDTAGTNLSEKSARAFATGAVTCSHAVVSQALGLSDDFQSGDSSARDAPSSYSPSFVSQLRGQLLYVQHQLSLEKTAHVDNVALLREQLQSLQTRLSTLQGWRMRELTDEQVESIAEEVRDAMRAFRDESRRRKSAAAALADGIYRCIVCTESSTRVCLVPCGHAQFCVKCCSQLQRCPLCRVPVQMFQQIYGANAEAQRSEVDEGSNAPSS